MKKFKIIASNEQLYGIGISYEISGLECTEKFKFNSDQYYNVEVKYELDGFEFTNCFDIPKYYLEEIK